MNALRTLGLVVGLVVVAQCTASEIRGVQHWATTTILGTAAFVWALMTLISLMELLQSWGVV